MLYPTPRRRRARVDLLESRRLLSAGDLDVSFASDGTAVIDLPGITSEIATAVRVYASGAQAGKTLIAGHGTVGSETDFFVARLTTAGALDTTFGGGDGFLTIDFALNDTASDVDIDTSGRAIVVGTASTGSGANTRDFAVARVTSTGVLDTTFSGDGKLTVDFGSTNDDGTSVAFSGGSVFVGGFKDLGATGQFLLAKINSAGALDTAYSGDGKVNFGFGGSNDSRCFDIAVDSAGRVVMVGYDEAIGGSTARNFAYARVGTDALLDPDFSGDGLAVTDFNAGADDEAHAVDIDYAGRIVVGGFTDGVGGDDFAATRVSDAGALDSSFNADGRFTVNLGGVEQADSLALHPDGTVTLGGMTSFGGFQAAMVQLTPTGNASTSFGDGGDGIQFIDFGGIDNGFALSVDPIDLRLVIAGTDGGGKLAVGRVHDLRDPNFADNLRATKAIELPDGKIIALRNDGQILKLQINGSIDSSFAIIPPSGSTVVDVAVDRQGRIVQLGQLGGQISVRRFLATGAPDVAFGSSGTTLYEFRKFPNDSSVAGEIAIDSLDRIAIAGQLRGVNIFEKMAVGRLTSSGNVDPAFGSLLNQNALLFEVAPTEPAGFDAFGSLAVDSQDRILFAGTASTAVDRDAFVARFDPDGTFDSNFGTTFEGGIVQFDNGIGGLTVHDIVVDSADRIVVVGDANAAPPGDSGFAARLTSAGLLDSSFGGGDGRIDYKFGTGFLEHSEKVAVNAAGTITIAGRFDDENGVERVIVRRLSASGVSVPSFSGDGAWVSSATLATGTPFALLGSGAVHLDDGRDFMRLNVDPAIVDFLFIVDAPQPTLRVVFNDDVSATLSPNDLAIGSPPISTTNYSVVSYDKLTNTALIRFNPGFVVPDGDYIVTFTQSGITNRQNMPLRGDNTATFFSLAGDANRDRTVGFDDLLILAQNFNQTGKTFSQGNFNYSPDGTVDFDDLLILAQKYNTSLLAAPVVTAKRKMRSATSLFV